MAKEIKQKIVLEGEKEYSAQLKEANRNLKTLQSQMKAETAELGKNASAQQKAEVRARSLQEQIKEQEKIVRTLQEALAEVREKYGDNEDAVARWEQKVNGARTTLANMKNDLAGVGDGMQGVAEDGNAAVTAANSLADSLGRISDIGGAISGSLENAFTGAVSAVKSAVTEIWGDLAELAAKSNNYVDLAGYWNTDVQTISKYAGAVRAASADLNDLNTLVTKINQVDEKKVAELTGVSGAKYSDRWQYAMAVMDALSQMDTLSRNKAGFEIFGRGATKMFDMANDWAAVQKELQGFNADEGGFGLSTEELELMSSYYDQINKLEEKWNRLREMGEVKLFASLAMDLTGNANAILDSLLKYFNAEDDETKEAAIQEMEQNITEAFDRVKGAIQSGIDKLDELAESLKNSENPTVKAIGNLLDRIVEALKWFTEDNMNNVVKAFETLATFWIAGKGLQLVSKVAEFAASLNTIRQFKITNDIATLLRGGAPGPSGTGAGGSGTGTGAGDAVTGTVAGSAVVRLLQSPLAKALGGGAAFLGTLFENAFKPQGNDDILQDAAGNKYDTSGNLIPESGRENSIVTTPEALAELQARQEAEYWENRPKVDVETGDYTRPHNPRLLAAEKEKEAAAETAAETGAGGIAGAAAQAEKETERAAAGISSAVADMRKAVEETIEELEISDYTDEDREAAFQDWWDAYRNNGQGLEDQEEVDNAFDRMATVFEDDFADVFDNINKMLDQTENAENMSDLPSSWWREVTDVVGKNQNPITRGDLNGVQSVLASLGAQVQIGAARGVSGIQVTLDGAAVGRMVAPYVSQYIAYAVG